MRSKETITVNEEVAAPVEVESIPALKMIIRQLSPIDWQAEAYPNSVTWRIQFKELLRRNWRHDEMQVIDILRMLDEMKILHLQYVDISVKKISERIKENNLILCRGIDTFFLYDGRWWEFPYEVFGKFMTDSAEKIGAPVGLGKELMKEFLRVSNCLFLDESSPVTNDIREKSKT